ncbi:Mitogen-activated protein kinase 9 [Capsicum chinense]|nr:Mitogen-activated protein kinase 9 [Capsicum chinense]
MYQTMLFKEFFAEYGEANQYEIQQVVGKGSYGVVAAAVDTQIGKKVAIKKINNVFEHVSESTRILREIKLLCLLRHPDIVEGLREIFRRVTIEAMAFGPPPSDAASGPISPMDAGRSRDDNDPNDIL